MLSKRVYLWKNYLLVFSGQCIQIDKLANGVSYVSESKGDRNEEFGPVVLRHG